MVSLLLFSMLPTWIAIFWRKYFATKRRSGASGTHPRTIIIYRLDQLGDLVLTTPLFRELKGTYPHARLTVAVQSQYTSILTTNRDVDEILPLLELKAKWLPARARC